MATIAEFALPADTLPLGLVFTEFPEATVELERVVPTSDIVRPYFWIENVSEEQMLAFFAADDRIEDATLVDTVGDASLFRYRSERNGNDVLTALVESDLTLLTATGTADGWTVTVRGDEQRAVADFSDRCRASSIPLTLRGLHEVASPSGQQGHTVTDPQREALLLALARGYYSDPRETTLDDLADEVGISRQAFSQRLRRGYRTLIATHLQFRGGDEDVT